MTPEQVEKTQDQNALTPAASEPDARDARIAELEKALRVHELAAPLPEDAQADLDEALRMLHDPHAANVAARIGRAVVQAGKALASMETQRDRAQYEAVSLCRRVHDLEQRLSAEREAVRVLSVDPRRRQPLIGEMYFVFGDLPRLVVSIGDAHQIGETYIELSVRRGTTNEIEDHRETVTLDEWRQWVKSGAELIGRTDAHPIAGPAVQNKGGGE